MNRFFATIILMATAIAMTAAVAAWIITTYHSMRWRPELLRVLEIDMYQNSSDGKWWLRIVALNEGEGVAEIYKVEVHEIETVDLRPPKTIEPGNLSELHIRLEKSYSYGTTYTVKLHLRSGTIYSVQEKLVRP